MFGKKNVEKKFTVKHSDIWIYPGKNHLFLTSITLIHISTMGLTKFSEFYALHLFKGGVKFRAALIRNLNYIIFCKLTNTKKLHNGKRKIYLIPFNIYFFKIFR